MSKNDDDPADEPCPVLNITDIARLAGVSAGTVLRALAATRWSVPRRAPGSRRSRAHDFRPNQIDAIERIAARYRPPVAWGHHRSGQRHCSVEIDNFHAGELAAEHVIAREARCLAFLGDVRGVEIAARCQGFETAAQKVGHDVVLLPTHLAADDMEADITRHDRLMAGEFDGVLAASTSRARRRSSASTISR